MSYQNTMDSSEIIGGAFTPTGPTGSVGAGDGTGPTGATGTDGGNYTKTYSLRSNNSTGGMNVTQLMVLTSINGGPVQDGVSFVGGGGRVNSGNGTAGLYKVTVACTLGVQGPFADEWEIECWLEKSSSGTKLPGSRVRFTVNGENGVARRRVWHRTIFVSLALNDTVRCLGLATDTGGGGGTASFGPDGRFNMELVNAD